MSRDHLHPLPLKSNVVERRLRVDRSASARTSLPLRETAMNQIAYLPDLARAILKATIVGLAIAGLVSDDQADALILVLGLRDA